MGLETTSNRINDALAKTYNRQPDLNYTQYLKYLLVQNHSNKGHICLDVGVANGVFAIPLSPGFRKLIGVDISQEMLRECVRNLKLKEGTQVALSKQSADRLGFTEGSFDLIYSFSTLLQVPNVNEAFREIHRLLKPGGKAILDITGRYNLSQSYWRKYYSRKGHPILNAFSLGEIEGIFTGLGFSILERHATGLTDNWKYIPLIKYFGILDRFFHHSKRSADIDYVISNRFPKLANRWYFVMTKS